MLLESGMECDSIQNVEVVKCIVTSLVSFLRCAPDRLAEF